MGKNPKSEKLPFFEKFTLAACPLCMSPKYSEKIPPEAKM
jgi:hypothetical protein